MFDDIDHKAWIGSFLGLLAMMFGSFYLGIWSTQGRTGVKVQPDIAHQFVIKYKVDSVSKIGDMGYLDLKSDDDILTYYGKEINLHVSKELANELNTGDIVTITIDIPVAKP
jgi:hypothetical protein